MSINIIVGVFVWKRGLGQSCARRQWLKDVRRRSMGYGPDLLLFDLDVLYKGPSDTLILNLNIFVLIAVRYRYNHLFTYKY